MSDPCRGEPNTAVRLEAEGVVYALSRVYGSGDPGSGWRVGVWYEGMQYIAGNTESLVDLIYEAMMEEGK